MLVIKYGAFRYIWKFLFVFYFIRVHHNRTLSRIQDNFTSIRKAMRIGHTIKIILIKNGHLNFFSILYLTSIDYVQSNYAQLQKIQKCIICGNFKSLAITVHQKSEVTDRQIAIPITKHLFSVWLGGYPFFPFYYYFQSSVGTQPTELR